MNLLTNPGFETGTLAGWTVSGAFGVTGNSRDTGAYAASCSTGGGMIEQGPFTATAGQVFQLSGWQEVNGTVGNPRLQFGTNDGGWSGLVNEPMATTPRGEWVYSRAVWTAPAGWPNGGEFWVRIDNSSPTNTRRFDDFALIDRATVPSLADDAGTWLDLTDTPVISAPLRRPLRRIVQPVLNRAAPIITYGTPGLQDGTLTYWSRTRAELVTLRDLYEQTDPLTLNVPGVTELDGLRHVATGTPEIVESMGSSVRWLLTVTVQEVA